MVFVQRSVGRPMHHVSAASMVKGGLFKRGLPHPSPGPKSTAAPVLGHHWLGCHGSNCWCVSGKTRHTAKLTRPILTNVVSSHAVGKVISWLMLHTQPVMSSGKAEGSSFSPGMLPSCEGLCAVTLLRPGQVAVTRSITQLCTCRHHASALYTSQCAANACSPHICLCCNCRPAAASPSVAPLCLRVCGAATPEIPSLMTLSSQLLTGKLQQIHLTSQRYALMHSIS